MTTVVSVVGVGALVAMIGLRPSPPPPVSATLPEDAPSSSAAAAAAHWPARVALRGGALLLDGVEIARTEAIAADGRMRKVDELFFALKQRRWDHPAERPSAVLDVAMDTPAVVVKSVYQTAMFAGVTDIQFANLPADAGAR